MDKPRHNDQLAVKKIGKKIKKTPLHLPSLANGCTSKNRLRRSIVPLLTSSPMPHDVPPPPPPAMAQPTRNTAESPVSVSLLQSSSGDQMQPSHPYRSLSLPSARFSGGGGILPTPASVSQSSFGDSVGPNRNQMKPSHDYQPPPRFYGSSASSVPILPSPRFDGPGILPTPPPLQYPSPLQPRSFTSSSMAQGGILGPGKFPRP